MRHHHAAVSRLALLAPVLVTGCAAFFPSPTELHPETQPAAALRAVAGGRLEAGAAAVDVTPIASIAMGGYGLLRRSEGVHDPIWARAVAVRQGQLTLAILALDVVGLHHYDVDEIRARVADLLPAEGVLIAATHNHDGPDTMGFWGLPPLVSGLAPDYQEFLRRGCELALRLAVARLEPAELRWGQVEAPAEGLSYNRRDPGTVDRRLTALAFDTPQGEPLATLVHYTCHPEVLGSDNHFLSSDFPHALRQAVEAERPAPAVFLNGALGGMVTTAHSARTFAEAERIGRTLGELALEALRARPPLPAGALELAAVRQPLWIPVQNWRFHLGDLGGVFGPRRFEDGYTASEVQALRLGPALLLTVPGEALPKLGYELEAQAAGAAPFLLVGLGGDELGYLIPPEDWADERYDYERTVSPGPLAVTALRRAVTAALDELGAAR